MRTKLLDVMFLLRQGFLGSQSYNLQDARYLDGCSKIQTKVVDTATNKVYLLTLEVQNGVHEASEVSKSAEAQK